MKVFVTCLCSFAHLMTIGAHPPILQNVAQESTPSSGLGFVLCDVLIPPFANLLKEAGSISLAQM